MFGVILGGLLVSASPHCVSRWPDDFQMQAACERNQREGRADWQRIYRDAPPDLRRALGLCLRRYTDPRGQTDYQMAGACSRNQQDSYRELHGSADSNLLAEQAEVMKLYCKRRYPSDPPEGLVACEKVQMNGLKQFIFAGRLGSLIQPHLRRCQATWTSDGVPNWAGIGNCSLKASIALHPAP
jgi:hypothetical protein